jgi:hypothetical protein
LSRIAAEVVDDQPTSGDGTSVWTGRALQVGYDGLEIIGLAHLYSGPLKGAIAPGHHGYPRTPDLIRVWALEGRMCNQITDVTVRPFLHLLHPTRKPRRELQFPSR